MITDIEQITVAMARSKFLKEYKKLNAELLQQEEAEKMVAGFFIFLYGKHNITSTKLMKALKLNP